MRILHIINSLDTGGAEKLLLDTIPLYKKGGIEMDLLVLWSNNHPFLNALRELNCCKIHVLKESSNYKDIYNLSSIFKIKKILKEYDIAHVHLFPSLYFTAIANKLNGNKTNLIFTEHSTSNSRMKNKLLKPIENYIYSKYQRLICITEQVKEVLNSYLEIENKTITIENGINITEISKVVKGNRDIFGYKETDKLIIMVAGFREQKDHETVIKCLKFLPNNFKLILIGDGERRKKIETLVTTLKLSGRVNLLGIRTDVYSFIKMSDISVLSSHWEGFGLAALEAMACSIPLIASNVPGLRDVVKDSGILFEKGNAEELAQKIQKLLSDSEHYASVANACLERAKQFDIKVMVKKHIELYESLS